MRVPKTTSRQRWLLPLILIALVLPLAMLTPRWPGDPQVARAIQGLGIPSAPAAWITSLAGRPIVFGVLGLGLVLATWRGRLRGFVVSALLIAIWWYAGEPLKHVVSRPRPTADLVQVVRPSSGFSFPSTFACFLTRAADLIRMAGLSNARNQLNVKLTGSHSGVSIGEDGPSQMALEDLGMMRAVPNCTVLYPSDAVSTERLVVEMAKKSGLAYMRTSRPKTEISLAMKRRMEVSRCSPSMHWNVCCGMSPGSAPSIQPGQLKRMVLGAAFRSSDSM